VECEIRAGGGIGAVFGMFGNYYNWLCKDSTFRGSSLGADYDPDGDVYGVLDNVNFYGSGETPQDPQPEWDNVEIR
jgi:hypothetical protein